MTGLKQLPRSVLFCNGAVTKVILSGTLLRFVVFVLGFDFIKILLNALTVSKL